MNKKLLGIVIILLIIYIIIPKGKEKSVNRETKEFRGVFISYLDLKTYIKDKSEKESKKNINEMIDNLYDNKFNTIILQVRSHMDSIYKSNIFPVSDNIILNDGSSYDVLEYFIKKASSKKINIYAWINPYRLGIYFNNKAPYYDRVKNDIHIVDGIYYLDPSSSSSTSLIVDGVEEVVKNYKIKGILFDDYFYPGGDIDNYSGNSMSIEEYRLENINNMVLSVHDRIKKINKNISFGISPDANVENNYQKNFADVKKWGSNCLYVDFLMPQIYYGFDNETKPFNNVIDEWDNIVTDANVKLYVALAFYKTGQIDKYAKSGEDEWLIHDDIIKRQILSIRNNTKYKGFSVFRYENLFNDKMYTENTINEINNLKEIM